MRASRGPSLFARMGDLRRFGRSGEEKRPRTVVGHVLPHVKVLFAFACWVGALRQQAFLLADWRFYYAQSLTALGALALASVFVVYLYPPRTARWRTLVWVFFGVSLAGALMAVAVGGRAGIATALVTGAAILWGRSEELARRTVRRLRKAWAGRAGAGRETDG